jgi:hypothetical protein
MSRLFSPDFDLNALGNARNAIRRGDDRAAQRWLKIADQQMSLALRLDMHRWMAFLRHNEAARNTRAKRADAEVRKWKNDVPFPLPNFSDQKPIFPQKKAGG